VVEIDGIEALRALKPGELGVSPWLRIDQDRIRDFADATGDHQWIHLDQARAAKESPWGTTIAHGLLTLSLLPHLNEQVFRVNGTRAIINYGLDRVRFTAPVPSGARVRARVSLEAVEPLDGNQVRARFRSVIEIEHQTKPACIAEQIAVFVGDGTA
jgi:acyl dehydratase